MVLEFSMMLVELFPKDDNFQNIDRIHSIKLLDPDLNAILKIKVNKYISKNKIIQYELGTDMYGCRPKKPTQDALIYKN